MVMLGTKRPSITSTWIQSAPAVSTARTSSPNRAKSADRTEGATMIDGILPRALTRSASSMEALADLIARALLCDGHLFHAGRRSIDKPTQLTDWSNACRRHLTIASADPAEDLRLFLFPRKIHRQSPRHN